MSAKRSKHVRYYVRAADLRLGDADFLRTGGRLPGSVYLAGYAVECLLKALILALVDEHEQPDVMKHFHGGAGHDFDGLRSLYRRSRGANFSTEVNAAFIMVRSWETSLRYESRADLFEDADDFFDAIDVIIRWAKQRIS